MCWTRHRDDRSLFDWYHRSGHIVRRETAAGTADPTGWPMIEQFRGVLAGQPTDRGKLLEMIVTADDRDRELVE